MASERSGTNLVRVRFTQSQSTYFGPSPAHFYTSLYYRTPFYGDLADDAVFTKLVDDALQLCYLHYSPWEIKLETTEVMAAYDTAHDSRSMPQLANFLMTRYAKEKGYDTYFSKDNGVWEFAWTMLKHMPNAKFIYLHRDPRDCAVFQRERVSSTKNMYTIARKWQYEQIKSIRLLEELGPDKVLRISYEDFVQHEDKLLKQICQFLNVPFTPQELSVEDINTGSSDDWSDLKKKTFTDYLGLYKRKLSAKDIARIEQVCWDEMRYVGYETEAKTKPTLSKWDRVWMIMYDLTIGSFIRWRHRGTEENADALKKRHVLLKKLRVNYTSNR